MKPNLNWNIEEIIEKFEESGKEMIEIEVGPYDDYEHMKYIFLLEGYILEKNGKVYEFSRDEEQC